MAGGATVAAAKLLRQAHAADDFCVEPEHAGAVDLLVLAMTMHVQPALVAALESHLAALMAVLRRHCAVKDAGGAWRWTTRLLWLLPHQPQDVQLLRQPYSFTTTREVWMFGYGSLISPDSSHESGTEALRLRGGGVAGTGGNESVR